MLWDQMPTIIISSFFIFRNFSNVLHVIFLLHCQIIFFFSQKQQQKTKAIITKPAFPNKARQKPATKTTMPSLRSFMGIRNVGAGILNKTDQIYVRHALSTAKGLRSKKKKKKKRQEIACFERGRVCLFVIFRKQHLVKQ